MNKISSENTRLVDIISKHDASDHTVKNQLQSLKTQIILLKNGPKTGVDFKEVKSIANQLKVLEKEKSDLKEMMAKEIKQRREAQNGLEKEKISTEQLQNQLDQSKQDFFGTRILIDKERQANLSLSNDVIKLKEQISNWTDSLPSDQKIWVDQNKLLAETNKQHASHVSTLEKTIEGLQTDISRIHNERVDDTALSLAKSENESSKQKNGELSKKIEFLTEMMSTEAQKLIEANTRLENEKSITGQLHNQIKELNDECSKTTEILGGYKTHIDALSSDQKMLVNIAETKKQHASQVSAFEKKIAGLQRKDDEHVQKLSKLSTEAQSENEDSKKKSKKIQDLETELSELEVSVKSREDLVAQINGLTKEIQGKQRDVDEIEYLNDMCEKQDAYIQYNKTKLDTIELLAKSGQIEKIIEVFTRKNEGGEQEEGDAEKVGATVKQGGDAEKGGAIVKQEKGGAKVKQEEGDAENSMAAVKQETGNVSNLFSSAIGWFIKGNSKLNSITENTAEKDGTTKTIETVPGGIKQGNTDNSNQVEQDDSVDEDGDQTATTKPIETVEQGKTDHSDSVDEVGNQTVTTKPVDGIEKGIKRSDVSPEQYVELQNLLSTKVGDIQFYKAVILGHTGFYGKHIWTCYVRDHLAKMKPRTEMHDLIARFTDPIDLDSVNMYELFRNIDKDILGEDPSKDDITTFRKALLRLLEIKYGTQNQIFNPHAYAVDDHNANMTTKISQGVTQTETTSNIEAVLDDMQINGNGKLTAIPIEAVSEDIKQDALVEVGNVEYGQMRKLLSTNGDEIKGYEESKAHSGYYSKHTWTCYVRDQLANMKPRTEMHNLFERFTDPLDLDNKKMFELFKEIDEGILPVFPKDDKIVNLKNNLLKLLKKKYKRFEDQRNEAVKTMQTSLRQQGIPPKD